KLFPFDGLLLPEGLLRFRLLLRRAGRGLNRLAGDRLRGAAAGLVTYKVYGVIGKVGLSVRFLHGNTEGPYDEHMEDHRHDEHLVPGFFSHLSSGGLVTILTFSTPASRMMPIQFTTKP